MEPNDAMRDNGIRRTKGFTNVKWFEGVGEHTDLPDDSFKLVTFGSSFNVTNRQEALKETQRILMEDGWFACMWNHRDLSDPVQQKIEEIIKTYVPDYDYGTRKEDQTDVIKESGRFCEVQEFHGTVRHLVNAEDMMEGWRSHGTVHRQAKEKFDLIMKDIETYIYSLQQSEIEVPYVTRGWMAKVVKAGDDKNRQGGGYNLVAFPLKQDILHTSYYRREAC